MTEADDHPFRLLGWRRLAVGEFLALTRAHYLAPGGRHLARDIVRHPGAVAVVIVEGDQVVLIRQFRSAVGRTLLEIPAGKLDEQGESPEAAARRECEEEVGLSPRRLEHLASFYTAPGYTDEWISVFSAEDLEPVATRPHGMEEEFAEVIRLGVDDALRMITTGEIVDAKTQIGLLVLAARRSP